MQMLPPPPRLPFMKNSICIQSKLFDKVLLSHKSKPEPRNSNRSIVYFYSSADILESVAGCMEFVHNKSALITNVS